MGIIIEAQRLQKPWSLIGKAYLSALSFYAEDSNKEQMQSDKECLGHIQHMNLKDTLYYVSDWEHSHLAKGLFTDIYESFSR